MSQNAKKLAEAAFASGPRARSLPWSKDEYLWCDAMRYQYTIGPYGVTVRLPGGSSVPLERLRDQGVVIIPPKRWRAGDVYA